MQICTRVVAEVDRRRGWPGAALGLLPDQGEAVCDPRPNVTTCALLPPLGVAFKVACSGQRLLYSGPVRVDKTAVLGFLLCAGCIGMGRVGGRLRRKGSRDQGAARAGTAYSLGGTVASGTTWLDLQGRGSPDCTLQAQGLRGVQEPGQQENTCTGLVGALGHV